MTSTDLISRYFDSFTTCYAPLLARGWNSKIRDLKVQIKKKLSDYSLRNIEKDDQEEAAVLIPVFGREKLYFLLTQRTQEVSTHKGQISFPGGVREQSDKSLLETALRETEEEIRISPSCVEVLGRFHDYLAVSGHCVATFVGYLKTGFSVFPNPGEVEHVLEVPLDFFLQAQPRCEVRQHRTHCRTVYFYDYNGEVIWGLTAQIIRDFLHIL